METAVKYNTKQREILIDYLISMKGGHVTAKDVLDHFRASGIRIGQSTVYRQLESLVSEGVVKKYSIDISSPACFEYEDEEEHDDHSDTFHLRCEKCGRLIHIDCNELKDISDHLSSEHSFSLDPIRTVLYGICESCRRN
ncbi:MAG: transcriptional repressor [Christensenellaceae bacterium]|nr:transcriptional repressor [Christensenellaceae bacterium]